MIIFILLNRSQRLIFHLQLHGLCHILAFAKPENQLIALTDTVFLHPGLVIERCQLIGPFLLIFMGLIFLQGLDLIVQTGSTLPIDLILQDISALIMRCSLYKFPIKFDCFLKIMSSGSNLRHLIKKHSSHRCAVISNIKNLHTVLIPFNGLVKIRYNIKHIQILDPAPVNGIRNLDCCLIIFLFYEFFYLLRFQAIFILIQ